MLTARKRNLDLIGAIALAVVCGLGGGLLRDMTLQVGDVYILKQPLALPISIATAAIIYIVPAVVDKPERLIPILDILSVGIYSATGADKAFVHGFDPFVCVMMGVFTAVGGGMLLSAHKLLRHCLHRRRSNLCGAHESYPHIQRGRTRCLRFRNDCLAMALHSLRHKKPHRG